MKEEDLVKAKARRMTTEALFGELTRIDHAMGITNRPRDFKRWRDRRRIMADELARRNNQSINPTMNP